MPNNFPGEATAPAVTPPHKPTIPSVMWTVGHSTRPIEDFIELLQTHGIHLLADVRITPYSRRNPQFHSDALAKILAHAGIQYRHIPG